MQGLCKILLMSDMQAAARRYVERVLKELGVTPGALAKMSGIAPSTLTRFMNSADHKFLLSSTTIERIARSTSLIPFELAGSEFNAESVARNSSQTGGERGTYILGEVQPGVWRDTRRHDPEEICPSYIPLHIPKWDRGVCFAIVVRGEPIGHFAQVGDFILCANFKAYISRFSIVDGNILIIERKSSDGTLIETTARAVNFRRVNGGYRYDAADLCLLGRGDQARKAADVIEDVSFDPEGADGVRIVGVALFMLRNAPKAVVR